MITSTSNNKIKKVNALQKKARLRKEEGLFVVEGIKMFKEVPKELLKEVYVSEDFFENNKKEIEKYAAGKIEIVSRNVLEYMSDTVTPQGILCLVKQPEHSLVDIINLFEKSKKNKNRFLILEDIRDPGNLGTIIRTSEAAGVTGVIMTLETADIFNPKVVRSTMGSIFRLPFVYVKDIKEAVESLQKCGIKTYATSLDADRYVDEISLSKNCAFLIGNEANGLHKETCELADELVKIPMDGGVESLNAAISAAVLIYYHKLAK